MHGTLGSVLKDLSQAYYGAKTFGDLSSVAQRLVARDYPRGAKILCAPGYNQEEIGDAKINILGKVEILEGATVNLVLANEPVLDMRIFLPKLSELWATWIEQDSKSHRHEYCEPLLEDFFVRLASSPQISGGYFINGSRQFKAPKRIWTVLKGLRKETITLPPTYHRSHTA